MARHAALRASDLDREQVADRLRRATAEGRLLAEELEDRLATAFRARTYGELEALVADLPSEGSRRRRRVAPRLLAFAAVLVLVAAVAAAVLLVVTGLAFVLLWAAAFWFFFGGRRAHGCRARKHGRGALYGRSAL